MIQVDRAFGAADRFQQRWPGLAFPVAVWKKFSDDQAGSLAALITYYAVAAIFPLLLVLGTVLNYVLKSNPELQADLINSALAQYPVIGPEIKSQLGEISGSGLALALGILFLLYAAEIDVVLVRRLWPRSLKSDTEQQPRVPGQRSGSGRVGSADDTKSSETKAA